MVACHYRGLPSSSSRYASGLVHNARDKKPAEISKCQNAQMLLELRERKKKEEITEAPHHVGGKVTMCCLIGPERKSPIC